MQCTRQCIRSQSKHSQQGVSACQNTTDTEQLYIHFKFQFLKHIQLNVQYTRIRILCVFKSVYSSWRTLSKVCNYDWRFRWKRVDGKPITTKFLRVQMKFGYVFLTNYSLNFNRLANVRTLQISDFKRYITCMPIVDRFASWKFVSSQGLRIAYTTCSLTFPNTPK